MTRITIAALAISAAAGLATTANAGNTLLTELFDYADGSLAGNGGWTVHSGAGGVPMSVSSGVAVISQGAGAREDLNTPIGSTLGAGQTFYAGFDFTNANDFAQVYFAHFFVNSSTFAARTYVMPPTSGGDYTVGISDGNTVTSIWGSDLSYGTTYRAVISYSFDTGDARLWVNPGAEGDTSIVATGLVSRAISGFALRQAGTASTQTVDNLIIGDSFGAVVPAPGTLALLGLGGLIAARRRRA